MCFDPVTAVTAIKAATATMGTTLGGLSTALTIGGGALSAYGQYQNSKATAKAAEASAKQADIAANQAIKQGKIESDRRRQLGARSMADNTAAMAANGVDVTGSHALDLLDDTRDAIGEDAFTIRENARRTAQGYDQQSANYQAEADTARSNAIFAPVKTLLTTSAKVGSKYSHLAAQGSY